MGKYTRVAVLSAFKLVGSFITFTKGKCFFSFSFTIRLEL